MRNLKLTIEYDGSRYCGWQVQNTKHPAKTIQAAIEKALARILRHKIKLIGSGRTDAGVHAQAQVANFKTASGIPCAQLQRAFNSLLAPDIVISRVEEAGLDFHSRFDAKSKVYRYRILNRPYHSAFLRHTSYYYRYPLNIKLMQDEAGALLGKHDFRSFQARDERQRGSVRAIKSIKISKRAGVVTIDIEADGFLYNMVRNISGTLIEIGRGKLGKGSLKRILLAKDRKSAGPTAPAKGLCLLKVNY